MQQHLTNQKGAEYRDIEEQEVNMLLKKLLECPADFVEHSHMRVLSHSDESLLFMPLNTWKRLHND